MQIQIPERLSFLFEPKRHKVAWGGRDGAKSWSFVQALLVLGIQSPKRILAAREIQRSIRQSVHQLMKDTIRRLDMGWYYEVYDFEIRSKIHRDGMIVYDGLQSHTADSIKSYEGIDICFVEEGQVVSDRSFSILLPTIRKPGSEIWIAMNPILESDPAWQLFCAREDPDTIAVHITYRDNIWSTQEMRRERERARDRMDEETFQNVWEGIPVGMVTGSIYGRQIKFMRRTGRIGMVPPNNRLAVNAFMDLGTSTGNATAIWLHQQSGTQHRFVKYWAEHGQGMRYWWDKMHQWVKERELRWGRVYMPHDGKADMQGAEVTNRAEILESLIAASGVDCEVVTVPRTTDLSAAIDLTREKLSDVWMDERECADGIRAMEHYQFMWDDETKVFRRMPLHNWASNGADAFRQWVQGYAPEEMLRPPSPASVQYISGSY